ncbi:MAG: GNAT family N-acetyltransferase [Magnetococcales bacterium]|nr:GNAT family N-acetyltransferase [Magnetococcales bacterium]
MTMCVENIKIVLRPLEEEKDLLFLQYLYDTTRHWEMVQIQQAENWTTGEIIAFLINQFTLQHRQYMDNYPKAEHHIIECNSLPIGRLYVETQKHEIRIIDIALVPEYQQQGIGGRLIQRALKRGENLGLPVSIHVENNNPAMTLYQRLGFKKIDEVGIYHLMRWHPDDRESDSFDAA